MNWGDIWCGWWRLNEEDKDNGGWRRRLNKEDKDLMVVEWGR
jgi:hypothetical protein